MGFPRTEFCGPLAAPERSGSVQGRLLLQDCSLAHRQSRATPCEASVPARVNGGHWASTAASEMAAGLSRGPYHQPPELALFSRWRSCPGFFPWSPLQLRTYIPFPTRVALLAPFLRPTSGRSLLLSLVVFFPVLLGGLCQTPVCGPSLLCRQRRSAHPCSHAGSQPCSHQSALSLLGVGRLLSSGLGIRRAWFCCSQRTGTGRGRPAKRVTALGQGRAGGVDAAGPGPPAPGLHEVLTVPFLALWAELKMTLGTGPGGATREFEVWNTLPTLGLCFHPGRAGCGTQGNISVDSGFPFPLSGVCGGPASVLNKAVDRWYHSAPAPCAVLRQALQGARAKGHLPSLPLRPRPCCFSHVHCLSLLGLLGKSFSG